MAIRVYCAGKISKNDWRRVSSPNYGVLEDRDQELAIRHGGVDWVYVGPWFRGCDHGCTHVPNAHAAIYECSSGDRRPLSYYTDSGPPGLHASQRAVLRNSLHQIAKCDVFYVRLDSAEAFGTFTEVGYAYALGKPLYVDVVDAHIAKDLWFLLRMALETKHDERILATLPWMVFTGPVANYRRGLLNILERGGEYPFIDGDGPGDPEAPFEGSLELPPDIERVG